MTVVAGSINQFTSYALSIVSLMIIYYIVKFFLVPSEGDEEAEKKWQERGGKLGTAVKDMFESKEKKALETLETKKKEEVKQKKREHSSPARDNLVKAIEACDNAINHIDNNKVKEAKKAIKDFEKELKDAWGNMKTFRRKVKDKEREFVQDMVNELEAVNKQAQDEIVQKAKNAKNLPGIRESLKTVRGSCGAVFKKLNTF